MSALTFTRFVLPDDLLAPDYELAEEIENAILSYAYKEKIALTAADKSQLRLLCANAVKATNIGGIATRIRDALARLDPLLLSNPEVSAEYIVPHEILHDHHFITDVEEGVADFDRARRKIVAKVCLSDDMPAAFGASKLNRVDVNAAVDNLILRRIKLKRTRWVPADEEFGRKLGEFYLAKFGSSGFRPFRPVYFDPNRKRTLHKAWRYWGELLRVVHVHENFGGQEWLKRRFEGAYHLGLFGRKAREVYVPEHENKIAAFRAASCTLDADGYVRLCEAFGREAQAFEKAPTTEKYVADALELLVEQREVFGGALSVYGAKGLAKNDPFGGRNYFYWGEPLVPSVN